MPHFQTSYGTPDSTSASGYALTAHRQSVVVALLSAGCFAGALLGVPTADYLGRRGAIFMVSVIFIVGVVVQIAPHNNLGAFIGGRFVAGLGVGVRTMDSVSSFRSSFLSSPGLIRLGSAVPRRKCVSSCIYPDFLYLSKLCSLAQGPQRCLRILLSSNDHVRHFDRIHSRLCVQRHQRRCILQDSYWVADYLGRNFMYALHSSSTQLTRSSSHVGAGVPFLPQSPRQSILNDQPEVARSVIARMHAIPIEDPLVQAYIDEITEKIIEEKHSGASYLDCFNFKNDLKTGQRTLIGCCVQSFQQLTGYDFLSKVDTSSLLTYIPSQRKLHFRMVSPARVFKIFAKQVIMQYYGTSIFVSINPSLNSYISQIIFGLLDMIGTLPGLYCLDR